MECLWGPTIHASPSGGPSPEASHLYIVQRRASVRCLSSIHRPMEGLYLRSPLHHPDVGLGLGSVTPTLLSCGPSIINGSQPGFHRKRPSTKPCLKGRGSCHPAAEGLWLRLVAYHHRSHVGQPSPCCTAASRRPNICRPFSNRIIAGGGVASWNQSWGFLTRAYCFRTNTLTSTGGWGEVCNCSIDRLLETALSHHCVACPNW